MQWVPIIAKTVQECLVLLSGLCLDEIGGTFGDLWELLSNFALVAESTNSAHKQARAHRSMELFGISRHDLGVKDEQSALAFILEISDVLFNDVLLAGLEWLCKDDLLFSVEQHHRVESGHAWHIEVTVSEGTAMAHRDRVGWESLEALSVFVGELEVILVHRILLETDSESVENSIVVLQLYLIWILLEGEDFLDVYGGFVLDHLDKI